MIDQFRKYARALKEKVDFGLGLVGRDRASGVAQIVYAAGGRLDTHQAMTFGAHSDTIAGLSASPASVVIPSGSGEFIRVVSDEAFFININEGSVDDADPTIADNRTQYTPQGETNFWILPNWETQDYHVSVQMASTNATVYVAVVG